MLVDLRLKFPKLYFFFFFLGKYTYIYLQIWCNSYFHHALKKKKIDFWEWGIRRRSCQDGGTLIIISKYQHSHKWFVKFSDICSHYLVGKVGIKSKAKALNLRNFSSHCKYVWLRWCLFKEIHPQLFWHFNLG